MILLATSPRRLGRAGQVELLLLLADVGQDRAQPLVLDNRCLVHLRPFVERALAQIDPIVYQSVRWTSLKPSARRRTSFLHRTRCRFSGTRSLMLRTLGLI